MSLVRRLLAQMDMHDAGAGVEGRFGLARHFLRGYRHVMLFRIGQHAVQRASDDSLVAHGSAFDLKEVARGPAQPSGRIMRPAPACFLRSRAIAGSGTAAKSDLTALNQT